MSDRHGKMMATPSTQNYFYAAVVSAVQSCEIGSRNLKVWVEQRPVDVERQQANIRLH